MLKSKQPMAFEAAPAAKEPEKADEDLAADDLAIDEDEEVSADEEVDLETGDDDLGVETAGEDDDSLSCFEICLRRLDFPFSSGGSFA